MYVFAVTVIPVPVRTLVQRVLPDIDNPLTIPVPVVAPAEEHKDMHVLSNTSIAVCAYAFGAHIKRRTSNTSDSVEFMARLETDRLKDLRVY